MIKQHWTQSPDRRVSIITTTRRARFVRRCAVVGATAIAAVALWTEADEVVLHRGDAS